MPSETKLRIGDVIEISGRPGVRLICYGLIRTGPSWCMRVMSCDARRTKFAISRPSIGTNLLETRAWDLVHMAWAVLNLEALARLDRAKLNRCKSIERGLAQKYRRRSARFPSQIGRQAQRMEAGYGITA